MFVEERFKKFISVIINIFDFSIALKILMNKGEKRLYDWAILKQILHLYFRQK